MPQTGQSGFPFRGAKIDRIFVGPSFLVTTRIEATRDAGGPRKPTQVLQTEFENKKLEIWKKQSKNFQNIFEDFNISIVWLPRRGMRKSKLWQEGEAEAWQTSQCDLWHFCISVVSVWLFLTPVPRPCKSHGTQCHCPLLGCCNFHHATPGGRKPSLCSRWKNLNNQMPHTPHMPTANMAHVMNEHRVTFSGRLNIHQQALNNTLDPAPECFQNLWSQLWTSLKPTISTKKHRKIVRKMDVEWSAMNGLQPPKSKFEASHEESHDRTLLLPPDREEINETIKFKMHQICIKYVSNMYKLMCTFLINVICNGLQRKRCLRLGKQTQNTHFHFSSPRKAWVLESSHHISTSRCLPGSVVRWKHAKNVW